MATEEEPTDVLYDFLYRDHNRLDLYYSQFFQGKLSGIEETEGFKEAVNKEGKGDVKIASYKQAHAKENSAQTKKTFDVRDMNHSDILKVLIENFVHNDFIQAPNGSLVLVNGALTFLDKHQLSITAKAALYVKDNPHLVGQIPGFSEELGPEQLLGLDAINNMINDGFFQPIFFIQSEKFLITGTVKENGLEEPISTYILKYGGQGLENVFCIGIKETSNYLKEELMPAYMNETEEFRDRISENLMGEESIKITPLALFRKIEAYSVKGN